MNWLEKMSVNRAPTVGVLWDAIKERKPEIFEQLVALRRTKPPESLFDSILRFKNQIEQDVELADMLSKIKRLTKPIRKTIAPNIEKTLEEWSLRRPRWQKPIEIIDPSMPDSWQE